MGVRVMVNGRARMVAVVKLKTNSGAMVVVAVE